MKVSYEEVAKAIRNNDTACAAEMLEGFGLLKDGTPPYFTSGGKRLVSDMLGVASVAAWLDYLDEGLAHELIERTAMTVDIFPFLRLVVAGAEIKNEDFDAIPENIRMALRRNDYTDQIARAIEDLNDETLEILIAFIIGEIESIHVKFNLPVIRRIYSDVVIPADLLFAFMAANLRGTIEEHFYGLRDALGALGGLSLLDVLLDGMHDGDKEEGHGCHCGGCHGGCGGCHGCHSDD